MKTDALIQFFAANPMSKLPIEDWCHICHRPQLTFPSNPDLLPMCVNHSDIQTFFVSITHYPCFGCGKMEDVALWHLSTLGKKTFRHPLCHRCADVRAGQENVYRALTCLSEKRGGL